MDTVLGMDKPDLFRFCNGLSAGRLIGMCLGYYLVTFMFLDWFVMMISGITAVIWTFISPDFGLADVFWRIFLVGHSIAFFVFAIVLFDSDFDESLCRRCDRPWGYAKSSDIREEETDVNGIPLLAGRKMVVTTTMYRCGFCGDYREETESHLYDPREDPSGLP